MQKSRKAKTKPSSAGKTMSRYTVAVSIMISFGPAPMVFSTKPKAMFLAGPLIEGDAWEQMADFAIERDHDIVCLEFGSDVAGGPANISVYEHVGDELHHWGKCDLWSRGDDDIAVILPEGCNFAFGYDGQHLIRMTGAPTSNLAEGFARAKTELRRISRRVTPAMVERVGRRLQ